MQGNNFTGGSGTGLKADWLAGGSGDDTLLGSAGNDVLSGGGGQDLLVGGAGDDYLLGDADYRPAPGAGVYFAETGQWAYPYNWDWVVTPGANNVYTFSTDTGSVENPADSAADVIYAGKGNDVAYGGLGNDVIFGESGADKLTGGEGNDIILGGDDNDNIWGGAGSDYLDGGDGVDTLQGDAGDDIIIGGIGDDTLDGGAGRDIYIYNRGDGVDNILEATASSNTLRFGDSISASDITLRIGSLMLDLGNGDAIHIRNFNQYDVFNSSSISSLVGDDSILGATNDANYKKLFGRRAA